jgi:hypothetical protein
MTNILTPVIAPARKNKRWKGFKALVITGIILLIPTLLVAAAVFYVAIKSDNFTGTITTVPSKYSPSLNAYADRQYEAITTTGGWDDKYEFLNEDNLETCVLSYKEIRTLVLKDGGSFYAVTVTLSNDGYVKQEPMGDGASNAWNACTGNEVFVDETRSPMEMFLHVLLDGSDAVSNEGVA